MGAREVYADALQDEFGIGDKYHVIWLVGAAVEPGSIGRIDDGLWVEEGDIQQRGITAGVEEAPRNLLRQDFTTEGGVAIEAKASGELNEAFKYIASAEAGLKFSFSGANAAAISLREVRERRVSNVDQLAEDMKNAWHAKRMGYGTLVVTHVLLGKWALVVVSSGAGAEAQLAAEVDIGKGPIDLANVTGKVSWRFYRNIAGKAIAESDVGVPIAYRLLKLDEKGILWWRKTVVGPGILPEEPVYLAEL
jgi:hypothetical protein